MPCLQLADQALNAKGNEYDITIQVAEVTEIFGFALMWKHFGTTAHTGHIQWRGLGPLMRDGCFIDIDSMKRGSHRKENI